jgi:hypothetical protein
MKYVFLKRNLAPKKYDEMAVILGDKRPSYPTVKNLFGRFKTGHLSTEDERSGRPTHVTFPQKVDATHSMILDN